ncbi:MAG: transposase, partial [Syntrophus sp. (in: bacteria)]|nr:transposase [Syntrophus sp. (in: bacteria)]
MYVCAHGKKLFVIAVKYNGEEEYRYIIASDMAWRTIDIVEAYTLRWLVEVFFQDWKGNEGWDSLTKQPGEDGSSRGLILSLLVDHCLFFHPDQLARLENKLPAYTVGSLTAKIKVECLLSVIEGIVSSDSPVERFKEFANSLGKNAAMLSPSTKHMVGRDLGKL